jgi:hypothetical protein
MAGFFKKIFGNAENNSPNPAQGVSVEETLEVVRLAELFRYFPLGEKVRYYPEYQQDGALDTLVLGYSVNDQFVYSPVDIRCREGDGHDVLQLTVDDYEQTVSEVQRFCFLIPFNAEDEHKRDYVRRAELGPRGPFQRHNVITLVACSSGGILSSIDTVVRKIMPLKTGLYAGHDVVLLDVQLDTLRLTDQRQRYRLPTYLPATLSIKDGDTFSCTLLDFSEQFVQLFFNESSVGLAAFTEYRRLTLSIDISTDDVPRECVLDGVMHRKTDTSLVMALQGIYKNGSLESLGLVDVLDIKASLLHHPATQQALAAQRDV